MDMEVSNLSDEKWFNLLLCDVGSGLLSIDEVKTLFFVFVHWGVKLQLVKL